MIILLLLILALAAYGQQTLTSVAVLPSDGTALNPNELEALTDEMREAALKILPTNAFVLLKQDVVVKRLGGAENYIKKCKESSCIVDLGKQAQVDYVAQANVFKLGKSIRLKVELYDVRTEGLVSMFNDEAANIKGLLAIVKKRVPAELFRNIIPSKNIEKDGVELEHNGKVMNTVKSSSNSEGYFTDSRDGKKYKTVSIGTQTWMAENLNYNASGSKCYDNNPANCQKYGRLYNWNTAMKACPKGWHLPSNEEWYVLCHFADNNCVEKEEGITLEGTQEEQWRQFFDFALKEQNMAGKFLKSTSGWNNNQGKPDNGTDAYGFSALPGGKYSDGSFNFIGNGSN